MKRAVMILFALFVHIIIRAQELPAIAEQQLENLASTETESGTEDDSYLQSLERFKKNPLSLNTATESDLEELGILTDLQINSFIRYRHLFGKIIDKYELQAIPAWDLITIKKIVSYITIDASLPLVEDMRTRFSKGEHSILIRVSQVVQRPAVYDQSANAKYEGSPQRIFVRYAYNYKKLLQFGITGDKDAGESFFSGMHKTGFDFYSFHFCITQKGIIRALVIGDFTVNMGQGLIQWQSMAFKKSAEVMAIKRQSPEICPYNSAGEFNFHRGVGITIRKKKIEATGFFSLRKLSANILIDSMTGKKYFSSFQTSGYHRTTNEISDKNTLLQTTVGGSVRYISGRGQAGINCIAYKFSASLQKRNESYNLYALSGDHWYNVSLDYSYTYKNMHSFAELAIDENKHMAFVNGLLISAGSLVDISLLYRRLPANFQSVNGNAFTENTSPSDENGMYAGLAVRPAGNLQLTAYADVYTFPWLKYLVDAPSSGKDFLVQLTYTPNKRTELYTRYKNESKQNNATVDASAIHYIIPFSKQSWRTQLNYVINPALTVRNRIELIWYDKKGNDAQSGFLMYIDGLYKPPLKPFSAIMRIAYFETTGYDARVYSYENDVLYSYSIPALSGKGYRVYTVLNYDVNKKMSLWLRYAMTNYAKKNPGTINDDSGKNINELKLQGRFEF